MTLTHRVASGWMQEGEYNPREANEERAKDAESQLYYSRRARPVDYKYVTAVAITGGCVA